MFFVIQVDTSQRKYFTEGRVIHKTPPGQIPEIYRKLREKHPDWNNQFPAEMVHEGGAYVELDSKAAPADFFEAGGAQMMSGKLKDVIEGFPQVKARFFPISVQHKGQPVERSYFQFCLHDHVDAVDDAASDVTRSAEGWLDKVNALVLDEGRIGDRVMFRITDSIYTVVREDLAQAILDSGCTGAAFVRVDAYSDEWEFRSDWKQRVLQRSKKR